MQQALDDIERSDRLEKLRLRWLASHRELAEERRLQEVPVLARGLIWGVGAGGVAVAVRLRAQVWQNLLDHACQYTAEVAQGRVVVDSFRDGRRNGYCVTDNGAGFDMARAARPFIAVQRMDRQDRFAGTGVG